MVICLERGANLHTAQLMPLPLTVSCFSEIQIGFTFLVPAHLGSHGQRAVTWVCVCVCCRKHNSTYDLRTVIQCIPLELTDFSEINGDSNSWSLRTTANTDNIFQPITNFSVQHNNQIVTALSNLFISSTQD